MHVQWKIEGLLAQTYLSVSYFSCPKVTGGNASPPCKVSDDIHTHLSIQLNDYVISMENITACKKKNSVIIYRSLFYLFIYLFIYLQ